jgi:hypothetical protein
MIFEMRTYRVKPGMRAQFLALFRSKTMPEHARLGMPVIGPFLSVENDESFVFLRGFSDMKARETVKASFYKGRLWRKELKDVLMPMLESYDVMVVDDAEGQLRGVAA